MPVQTKKFEYGPQWKTVLLAIFFFGFCLIYSIHLAVNNESGLILNGFIKFSVSQANVFYWGLAAVSACFVLMGICQVVFPLFLGKKYIEITQNTITIPSFFSNSSKTLYFSEIINIKKFKKGSNILITIETKRGKGSFSNSFNRPHDFDEVLKIVIEKSDQKGQVQ